MAKKVITFENAEKILQKTAEVLDEKSDKGHTHPTSDLEEVVEQKDIDEIWNSVVIGDDSGDGDITIVTTDYNSLGNKPLINGVVLSGDLNSSALGLADKNHKHFYSELDGVPKIPSKTSDLENDGTYVTPAELESAFEEYDTHTHSYNELTNKPVIPSKLSDLTNDLSLPSVEYIDQKLEAKANVVHKHSISNVTDLQQILDNKSNNGHAHAINEVQGLMESLEGKASVQHTHGLYEINNLNTQLNAKADVQHTHSIEEISFLQPYLDSKSDDGHSHSFSSLTDKPTIPTLVSQLVNDNGFVTNDEMMVAIGNAQLGGGEGNVDLSYLATKEELNNVNSILNNKAELEHTHTGLDISVNAITNLYDSESSENLLDTYLENDGTFSANEYYKVSHKISVVGGETYSAICDKIWLYVMPYDENDNALLTMVHCDGKYGFSITVPENASYIRICIENYKNIDESSIIFNANVDLQTIIDSKADVEHTHDEYITSDEVNELVGNVDIDNIPISSITAPKNLYDENSPDNIPDANVDEETGAVIDNTMTGATLTHKIEVNVGDTYILTTPPSAFFFVLYYDSSDLMLGTIQANGNSTMKLGIPENVAYVRFYDVYGYGTAGITFVRYDEVTKRLEELANHNHDNVYYKKELIDQSKLTIGYLDDNGEVVTSNYNYLVTDFIKVYSNVEYIYVFSNLGDMICFYDEDKNFVDIRSTMSFTDDRKVKEVTIVPPEGVSYVRMEASVKSLSHLLSLTFKKDLIETLMVDFKLTSTDDIDLIWNES